MDVPSWWAVQLLAHIRRSRHRYGLASTPRLVVVRWVLTEDNRVRLSRHSAAYRETVLTALSYCRRAHPLLIARERRNPSLRVAPTRVLLQLDGLWLLHGLKGGSDVRDGRQYEGLTVLVEHYGLATLQRTDSGRAGLSHLAVHRRGWLRRSHAGRHAQYRRRRRQRGRRGRRQEGGGGSSSSSSGNSARH